MPNEFLHHIHRLVLVALVALGLMIFLVVGSLFFR